MPRCCSIVLLARGTLQLQLFQEPDSALKLGLLRLWRNHFWVYGFILCSGSHAPDSIILPNGYLSITPPHVQKNWVFSSHKHLAGGDLHSLFPIMKVAPSSVDRAQDIQALGVHVYERLGVYGRQESDLPKDWVACLRWDVHVL